MRPVPNTTKGCSVLWCDTSANTSQTNMTSRLPAAAMTEAPTLARAGSVLAVHSSATPSSTRKMDQTC